MKDSPKRPATLGGLLDDLHLTKHELAGVLGVVVQELDESSSLSSRALPQRVKDFSEITMATAAWEESIPQAFAWFSNRPIPSLGNQTAADLLRLNRADAVKTYLDRIGDGGCI